MHPFCTELFTTGGPLCYDEEKEKAKQKQQRAAFIDCGARHSVSADQQLYPDVRRLSGV
jgi:hypothetical protein